MQNLISDSNTSKTADVVEMEKQNGSTHDLVNELRTVPNNCLHLQICPILLGTKSFYISRALSYFYETEFEIWAGFGPTWQFGVNEFLVHTFYKHFHLDS